MKSNYLKYWRVVRHYVIRRWGLNTEDLDMLLFIYSEDYFSRERFKEFEKLVSWDEKRFKRLLKEEWITVFRPRFGSNRTLYQISFKGSQVVDFIYNRLEGSAPFAKINRKMHYAHRINSAKRGPTYTERRYVDMIEEMNAIVREKRREERATQRQPRPSQG